MQFVYLLLDFVAFTWWIWTFLILFPAVKGLWLFYKQAAFKNAINWALIELRIPREVKRSARAMEQVLAAMHSLRNAPDGLKETYMEGQVTRWFSLEIVSFGGEVHFYIRTPEQFKTLIQAPLFSYYPDVEVVDADDYMDALPKNTRELYSRDLDIWGTELKLAKSPAFPIKTYPNFESGLENANFDPIANLLEVLGKLKREEVAAVHFVIRPKAPDWRESLRGEIDKLRDSLTKPYAQSKAAAPKLKYDFSEGILPKIEVDDGKDNKQYAAWMTPGLGTIMGSVENNLSKPAFDTIIRIMYMGPKAAFFDSFVRAGVTGSFNQYASLDLNSFKGNSAAGVKAAKYKFPYFFVKERSEYKKQRFLYNFRRRELPEEEFMSKVMTSYLLNFNTGSEFAILNIESLATLFHIPTNAVVATPHVKRVESKKVGPPAGIPIFGDEEEIDRFK